MALAIHKLTAGSGYTYLTRQVAIQDATERGHSSEPEVFFESVLDTAVSIVLA